MWTEQLIARIFKWTSQKFVRSRVNVAPIITMCWSTDGTMYAWTPSFCINFRSSAKRSVVFTFGKDGWKKKKHMQLVMFEKCLKKHGLFFDLVVFAPAINHRNYCPYVTAESFGRRLNQKARSVWVKKNCSVYRLWLSSCRVKCVFVFLYETEYFDK